MTDRSSAATRVSAVDGLRALALLPVVAVNWVGYSSLPAGGPLGAPEPVDSIWAMAALWLVATLFAGKGIALLSFLFGYSQGLSRAVRGAGGWLRRGKRMQRLLVLGLLHGLLIYSGDILVTYAICGWLMLRWAELPLRNLKRRLLLLVALDLLLSLLLLLFLLLPEMDAGAAAAGPSMATPASLGAWLALNAGSFIQSTLGVTLLGLPRFLALMTAGLMAARLRLLSHPRWRTGLSEATRRWLVPAVVLNFVWGWAYFSSLRGGTVAEQMLCLDVYFYTATLLGCALIPRLVLAAQCGAGGLLRALAPLGRHSLSVYLGSSVLSLLLLSGAGLALPLGTAALLLMSLAYWGGWLALAPRLRGSLPLEAWVAR